MTQPIFRINGNNCDVDLPEIFFMSDETDDCVILTLDIERDHGIISDFKITKAEYFIEHTCKRIPIMIQEYMDAEVIKAIEGYDNTAFTEYEPPIRDMHDYYGVAAWQFS